MRIKWFCIKEDKCNARHRKWYKNQYLQKNINNYQKNAVQSYGTKLYGLNLSKNHQNTIICLFSRFLLAKNQKMSSCRALHWNWNTFSKFRKIKSRRSPNNIVVSLNTYKMINHLFIFSPMLFQKFMFWVPWVQY